jgi:hypothetical protein
MDVYVPTKTNSHECNLKLMDEMTPFVWFFFNFSLEDINDLFYMNVTELEEIMNEIRWLESNKVYHEEMRALY